MKIKEFCEEYTKIPVKSLKDNYFNDHVHLTRDYIPYIEKITIAKNLAQATMLDTTTGNIKVNTPLHLLLFTRTLIQKYTDLEIETEGFYDEYDELVKNNAIEKIIGMIPESELNDFKSICDMAKTDLLTTMSNSQNMVAELLLKATVQLGTTLKDSVDYTIDQLNHLDKKELGVISQLIKSIQKKQ